jgi:hypothetical protein
MPDLSANEIITYKHIRTFIQFGGPGPLNEDRFAGQDAQYTIIQGVSAPESGAIDPIWVPDPRRAGQYKLVGRSITPADLAAATLVMREKHGAIPRQLQRINCAFNLYNVVGDCKDLSDFLAGWSDYVLIYSGALVTDKDLGDRQAWDSDDAIEDSLSLTLADIYPIGPLAFGSNADNLITLEVVDVVYGSAEQCGDCGPQDDGTKRIYAVTKSSGSTPGTAPKLIYTVDGGNTWTQGSIDTLGATEDPAGIDIVGQFLVVYTRTAGGPTLSGYYYSEINGFTGVPGTWTKVTSGFVASFQIYDMYVLSPREIFFSADGGGVYQSTDIATGVTLVTSGVTGSALFRISGHQDSGTLVAVGGSGAVLKSVNRGDTWQLSTAAPVVATLQAVAVQDANLYWVGSAGGRKYFTLDGGETWTEQTFSGSGAGQVRDIVFLNNEVGYMSHDTIDPTARLFATWDGGRSWTYTRPRILGIGSQDRINRIAVPQVSAGIAANNVAVAGLAGNGSDGILLLGIAARL